MKSSFLLFVTILFSMSVSSQHDRHIVEVSGSGGISPGILASYSSIYTKKGSNALNQRSISYNGLLNAEYTFLTSKRFGLGVRCSYQQMRIRKDEYISYSSINNNYNSYYQLKSESPAFHAISALFIMKFTPKSSILPFGLEHTIGFGPRFYRMVNKPYYGSYRDSTGSLERGPLPQEINTDLENQRYRGFEMLYGLAINYSVGTGKFISIGFDFHASIVNKNSYNVLQEPTYDSDVLEEKIEMLFYNRNYVDNLSSRALFSIMNFKVGYKITF